MKRRAYRGKPAAAAAVRNSLLILLLGAALGAAAKLADLHSPLLAELTSGIAFWILLASAAALGSRTPGRAGLHALLLLGGMVAAYYVTAALTDSVWSEQYLLGWSVMAVLSGIPAVLVWYAKGRDWLAWGVSAAVIAAQLAATWLLFRKIGGIDWAVVLVTAVMLFGGKVGKLRRR